MRIDVDASQVRALATEFGRAATTVGARAERIIADTARDIELDAQALAPVDDGELRESISSDVRGLQAEIGASVRYAHYVEYGTSDTEPQPYMGPALMRNEPKMVSAFQRLVRDIL